MVVGSGAPRFARAFAEDMKLEGTPIFSDEKLASYRAAGFSRSLGGVLHPRAALAWIKAIARGAKQTGKQGDALQQGGVLVVKPGGEVAWRYASAIAGDHPAPERVVEAVRSAR